MLLVDRNHENIMGEIMNLDLDYQQMGGFGDLSPIHNAASGEIGDMAQVKTENEMTLLNISGNKPVMTSVNGVLNSDSNNFIENSIQTSPENIDHLLKIIENQEKQNERMLIQFRLKQVLLEYLKNKSGPQTTNTSPSSLSDQQNHCLQHLETDHRIPILSETKNTLMNVYPIRGHSPQLLTPPISPDVGQQFLLNNYNSNGEQKLSSSLPFIGLNKSQEVIESQELSDSLEKYYSSETEEKNNNRMSFEEEEEDFEHNSNRSLFEEPYDYQSSHSSSYPNCMPSFSSENCSKFNTSSIESTSQTKRDSAKEENNVSLRARNSNRGRKKSTQSAPGETSVQMQKRSAHLSAEFRYRTKLNDKITKLRNIVGPKSQLSKSGVLSRSIDLITKLQKSNTKLKEENKKIRILLMQACNQLPSPVSQQANLLI